MNPLWLQVGLLLPLGGFLVWKQRQRRKVERREAARRLDGHGIVTAELRTHLDNLSQRHLEISHERRRGTVAHAEFVASVRKRLCDHGFFRDPNHSAS